MGRRSRQPRCEAEISCGISLGASKAFEISGVRWESSLCALSLSMSGSRACLFLQVAGVGLFSGNAARLCPVTQRPRRALGLNKLGPLTRTAVTRSEAVHGKSEQQHPVRGMASSTSKLCKPKAGEERKASRRVCAVARGFWHKQDVVPHQLQDWCGNWGGFAARMQFSVTGLCS